MTSLNCNKPIDAQLFRSINENIYCVQSTKTRCDNTVIQCLFPEPSKAKADLLIKILDDSIAEKGMPPHRVPSLSPSERIRNWDTEAAHLLHSQVDLNDSTVHFDPTGLDFHPAETGGALYGSRAAHDDGSDELSYNAKATVSPQAPFIMRAREVEKRFREQMDVHRGLTRAARQLDVTQKSVQAFQAERRTRAVLQAIQERQAEVWKRVWPDGHVPSVSADTAFAGLGRPFPSSAESTIEASAIHPAVRATASAATAAPPPPASPVSAASPTSDLLKDILKTFSKPRETCGDVSSTDRSATSPAAAGGDAPRSRSRSSGLAATTSLPPEPQEVFPPAKRFTASGVEIVAPPTAPRPHTVVRYVEVTPHHTPSSRKDSTEKTPAKEGELRKAARPVNAASDVAEEFSEPTSSQVEDNVSSDLNTIDDSITDDVNATARSDSDAPSSIEDDDGANVYSSDSFEVDDEADDSSSTARETTVPSDLSSRQASNSYSTTTFTDSVEDTGDAETDAVDDERSVSTFVTSSVASTVLESMSDGGRRVRGRRRGGPSRSNERSTAGKASATADEVVARFLAACEAVNNTAKQLLQSPFVRDGKQKQENVKGATSLVSSSFSHTPSSSKTSKASQVSTESKRSISRRTSSPLLTAAKVPAADDRTTHDSAAAPDVSPDWRARLEKELRNVRHLRRFRDHLLRHLDVVAKHRAAQREQRRLLQQTQAIAKARQTVLRHATKDGEVNVEKLLKKLTEAPQQLTGKRGARKGSRRVRSVESEVDDIVDEVATEISDAVSDDLSSAIEEDIASEDSVTDEIDEAVSESIVEEEDWEDSAVSSDFVSESINSIDEDFDDGAAARDRRGASSGSVSTISEETFADDDAETVLDPERRGFLALAGEGLDEIEEELADRLAELSSSVLTDDSSVPSDVEELVDLLPSSLIPSEVEDEVETDVKARNRLDGAASAVSTESAIATESNYSDAMLHEQQRRTYTAAVRSANFAGKGGNARGINSYDNNKAYMQSSIASSVFTVSSDADVDTVARSSVISSTMEEDELSAGLQGVVNNGDEATTGTAEAAAELSLDHAKSTSDDSSSEETESDSTDALTALEADMALTKKRRQAALRSASAVPSFSQLYDPRIPTARRSSTSHENTSENEERRSASTSDNSDSESRQLSSSANTMRDTNEDRTAELNKRSGTAPASREGSVIARPVLLFEGSRHLRDATAVRAPPRAEAEAQTELSPTEANVATEPLLAASTCRTTSATPVLTLTRKEYAKEDLVAQSAWKARQFHTLRQLRSGIAEEAVRQVELEDDADTAGLLSYEKKKQVPLKSSADVAMDAAEDAAREEFAQHWGVLESLLQTRFAPPRYEVRMTPSSRRDRDSSEHTHMLRRGVISSDTPSTRDASRSSWSASSSVPPVV